MCDLKLFYFFLTLKRCVEYSSRRSTWFGLTAVWFYYCNMSPGIPCKLTLLFYSIKKLLCREDLSAYLISWDWPRVLLLCFRYKSSDLRFSNSYSFSSMLIYYYDSESCNFSCWLAFAFSNNLSPVIFFIFILGGFSDFF